MQAIEYFSLNRVSERDEDIPRSRLLRQGQSVGVTLEGTVLEAQFALDANCFLLLITEDCPYEETLHIYLLDAEYAVVDRLRLGEAYCPGILRDVRLEGRDMLQFAFIGEAQYRLAVDSSPRRFWNRAGRRRLRLTPVE